MRALVDCNNFFVSCERVFNPDLNGRPVVVLSGNDGCIIARSNEAKALGIPMGAPAFQWREVLKKNNVTCFSGNHVLYYDMSRRIMTILSEMVENLEIFSVDEAFFDFPKEFDESFLVNIARRVQKCTGIPVSIGASRTRTLAKLASHIAKTEYRDTTHCFVLDEKEEVHKRLYNLPVGEIWGIGRRMRDSLAMYNVKTAAQFAALPRQWVKKHYTINGERTWLELHGVDCAIAVPMDAPRQSLMHSRTFATEISDETQLSEIIASFTSICAAKLRQEGLLAGRITVFLAGNRFHTYEPQYSNSSSIAISYPTSSTIELVKYASAIFRSIYRKNCSFKRAGVQISEMISSENYQLKLFNPVDQAKHNKLMEAVDNINTRISFNGLHLAADGGKKARTPVQQHKSREFTTSFKDILTINCEK